MTGNPIVIGENAGSSVNTQAFSTSSVGTVAFQRSSGGGVSVVRRFDRKGTPLGDLTEASSLTGIALSPDGQRLAISMAETGSTKNDLWIRDLKRGTQTRFTFDPGDEVFPVWNPAGDTIAFASDRAGGYAVMVKPVSGVTEEKALPGLTLNVTAPVQYTATARYLTIFAQGSDGPFDSWALPRGDAAHPIPIASTQFTEMAPGSPRTAASSRSRATIRPARGLRAGVPEGERPLADLDGRRRPAALAARRQGAHLPHPGEQAHGGPSRARPPDSRRGRPALLFAIHPSPNGHGLRRDAETTRRFLVNTVPDRAGLASAQPARPLDAPPREGRQEARR